MREVKVPGRGRFGRGVEVVAYMQNELAYLSIRMFPLKLMEIYVQLENGNSTQVPNWIRRANSLGARSPVHDVSHLSLLQQLGLPCSSQSLRRLSHQRQLGRSRPSPQRQLGRSYLPTRSGFGIVIHEYISLATGSNP